MSAAQANKLPHPTHSRRLPPRHQRPVCSELGHFGCKYDITADAAQSGWQQGGGPAKALSSALVIGCCPYGFPLRAVVPLLTPQEERVEMKATRHIGSEHDERQPFREPREVPVGHRNRVHAVFLSEAVRKRIAYLLQPG